MLITNLWTEMGHVNGSKDRDHNMSGDLGYDSSAISSVLFVHFDEYSGPQFPDCISGVVPVFPATRQISLNGAPCSGTHFPCARPMRSLFTKVKV